MMEKEEKISYEDNEKLIRLVDYGSSSEDEDHAPLVKNRRLTDPESNTDDDESPAAPMKKQCLIDSELDTSLSENETAHMKKQCVNDSEMNASLSRNDDESPAAPMKKQCLIDSELNTSLSENEAVHMKKQCVNDSEMNASLSRNDDESSAASMKKQCLNDSELNTSLSENEVAPMKKQCVNDSEMNASLSHNGSSNSVSEEENWIVDYDTASDDSVGNDFFIETDNDLLDFGPYSWRTGDTWNKREEYIVILEGKREESNCLEALSVIGCEERFLGCSVEMCRAFFAQLIENEANKLKGVKGVRKVIPRRGTYNAI